MIEQKRGPGRPRLKNRRTPADYAQARQQRRDELGVKEVRFDASATERQMLHDITIALGFKQVGEMVLDQMRERADELGVSYAISGLRPEFKKDSE